MTQLDYTMYNIYRALLGKVENCKHLLIVYLLKTIIMFSGHLFIYTTYRLSTFLVLRKLRMGTKRSGSLSMNICTGYESGCELEGGGWVVM